MTPNRGRVDELVDLSRRTQRSQEWRTTRLERERWLRCGMREEMNGNLGLGEVSHAEI
jgi:hypothetical protein